MTNKKRMSYEDSILYHVGNLSSEKETRDFLKYQYLDNLLKEISFIYENNLQDTNYFAILLQETAKQFSYSKLRLMYEYQNRDTQDTYDIEKQTSNNDIETKASASALQSLGVTALSKNYHVSDYDTCKWYASEYPRDMQRDITRYTRTQENYSIMLNECFKEVKENIRTHYSNGIYSECFDGRENEYLKDMETAGDGMDILNHCIMLLIEYSQEMLNKYGFVDFNKTFTEKRLSKTTYQWITEKRTYKEVEFTYKRKVYQNLESYIMDNKRKSHSNKMIYVQDFDEPEIYYSMKPSQVYASVDSSGLVTTTINDWNEREQYRQLKDSLNLTDKQKLVLALYLCEKCYSLQGMAFMYSLFMYREDYFEELKSMNYNIDHFVNTVLYDTDINDIDVPKECCYSRQYIKNTIVKIEKKFINNGYDFENVAKIRDENMYNNMTEREFISYIEKVKYGNEI